MSNLVLENQKRWADCKINPSKDAAFNSVVKRLTAPDAVAQYKEIEKETGVPWWFIAVVHEREASQRWDRSLAQGDPWNKKSVNVPAGRGPFKSFKEAAVDALVNCGPFAAKNKDWSPGGALAMLEKYNGLGYANRNLPSPYIWAGTNQYVKGKFVADHVFDPEAVDKQLGCAGLLIKMNVLSKTTTPSTAPANVTAGGVVAAGGTALTQTEPSVWPYIILGTVVLAVVGWITIHWYNKRLLAEKEVTSAPGFQG